MKIIKTKKKLKVMEMKKDGKDDESERCTSLVSLGD
jgi:hypothetical protein